MTLTDKAVLEVDAIGDADGPAAFILQTELEVTRNGDRSYILAERGQYVTEAADILPDSVTDPISGGGFARREGYHIDGGAGTHTFTLSAERGAEDSSQWGDGSADEESTQYDAVPGDLAAAEDVLDHWLNETRSDSGGQTRLYISGYSDGTYADEPGAFGEPIPVAVYDHTISRESLQELEITLELVRTATIPDVRGILEDVYDDISGAVDDALDYLDDEVLDH